MAMRYDDLDLHLIYDYMVRGIMANSGYGFHNSDQGHPAYRNGAAGGDPDGKTWGDSPQQNDLFKTLIAIHEFIHDDLPEELPAVRDWQSFCQLAIDGYDNANGNG